MGTTKKHYTEEDYHSLAVSKNIEWMGDCVPKNTLGITKWKCSQGHVWEARYNAILRGTGCPDCYKYRRKRAGYSAKKRIRPSDYIVRGREKGFVWAGTELPPEGVVGDTHWVCSHGHSFVSSVAYLPKSCPVCDTLCLDRRYSSVEKACGLVVLAKNKKASGKSTWLCKNGHKFEKSVAVLDSPRTNTENSCPYCHRVRLHINDFYLAAKSRGFIWLGTSPTTAHIKTLWRCKYGHSFEASYANIAYGHSGCPKCSNSLTINGHRCSKTQIKLSYLIPGSSINLKVGRYSIDVALEGEKIGIEYDTYHWHRRVCNTEVREATKDAYLLGKGWKIIRIRSNGSLPTKAKIKDIISKAMAGISYQEVILADWAACTTHK